MTLEERYAKANLDTLIEIVESKEDYTRECVEVVTKELVSREFEKDKVHALARQFARKKIKQMLNKFNPLNTKLSLPHSRILKRDELMEILKVEFEAYAAKRKDLEIDVWKYLLGAGGI
ncbi:MAG: hypothetical protein IIA45_05015 [Bacteroidetes bacterium]|nr:hypothetical protein [Bacteroidota bacterium]